MTDIVNVRQKTTDFVLKTTDEEFVVFFLWRQITYQTNSVIICDENELRQRKQLSLYSKRRQIPYY